MTEEPADHVPATVPEPPLADDSGSTAGAGSFDLETVWRIVEEAIPPAGEDPFVGAVLGGVRLVRVVGEGGMGRVYEGLQEHPSRTVAVKLQRPGRLERESTLRFLRELEILGKLSHPALCRVFHAGFLPCGGERLPWFVMEYVPDALPITRFAETHDLSLRRRVELFRDVCDGVAAAHALGVVHRDIKPGNIIVGSDGLPKVIDFGVAAAFRGDLHATALTRAGQIVGTIESIAPEHLAPQPAGESPRSDVWSLGVVLHELVTGSSPFRVEEASVVTAVERIRAHRPALAARCTSRLGRSLGSIVDKALAPRAEDRHADAAALAAEFTTLLDHHPAGHRDWGERGHLAVGPRAPARRRWLLPAAGAAAIAASLVPWGMTRWPRDQSADPLDAVTAPLPGDATSEPMPPVIGDSPLERPDFRHVVCNIDDPEADRHLVESSGMRKWREDFGQHFQYWGPDQVDVEGRLVYRYDFPRPSRRVHLEAHLSAKRQRLEHGIIGNGGCALECSKDGHEWLSLGNTLEPRVGGLGLVFDGLLPDEACGGTSLWLRVRLLSTGEWKRADYALAQFLRCPRDHTAPLFAIEVECELEGGGSAAPPLSD